MFPEFMARTGIGFNIQKRNHIVADMNPLPIGLTPGNGADNRVCGIRTLKIGNYPEIHILFIWGNVSPKSQ